MAVVLMVNCGGCAYKSVITARNLHRRNITPSVSAPLEYQQFIEFQKMQSFFRKIKTGYRSSIENSRVAGGGVHPRKNSSWRQRLLVEDALRSNRGSLRTTESVVSDCSSQFRESSEKQLLNCVLSVFLCGWKI